MAVGLAFIFMPEDHCRCTSFHAPMLAPLLFGAALWIRQGAGSAPAWLVAAMLLLRESGLSAYDGCRAHGIIGMLVISMIGASSVTFWDRRLQAAANCQRVSASIVLDEVYTRCASDFAYILIGSPELRRCR